jgi:hypothetical protein
VLFVVTVRAQGTDLSVTPIARELSNTSALEANGEYYVRVRAHTRARDTWFFWPWDHAVLGLAKFTFIP